MVKTGTSQVLYYLLHVHSLETRISCFLFSKITLAQKKISENANTCTYLMGWDDPKIVNYASSFTVYILGALGKCLGEGERVFRTTLFFTCAMLVTQCFLLWCKFGLCIECFQENLTLRIFLQDPASLKRVTALVEPEGESWDVQ